MDVFTFALAAATLASQALAPASCGVRETLWIDHYVAALYLPPQDPPAKALQDPRRAKTLRIQILSKLFMPNDIPDKWRGTLEKSLDPETYARLRKAYRSLGPGDLITIEYDPGPGVRVQINDRLVATTPDHKLIDALIGTWAEGDPLPEKLKRIMTKNRCRA